MDLKQFVVSFEAEVDKLQREEGSSHRFGLVVVTWKVKVREGSLEVVPAGVDFRWAESVQEKGLRLQRNSYTCTSFITFTYCTYMYMYM